jgi:DNA-binding FrmR family transcriptional regulator
MNCHEEQAKAHHSPKLKKNLISRLNRIEGQVRGVKIMIEEDVYCDNVLNLISSIQSALSSTANLLVEHHIKSCVVERLQNQELEVIDELMSTLKKLNK